MEDDADISEALDGLDGLDDFFQDENLFQDLEDLGKVLDELNSEGDDGGESSDATESGKKSFEFDPDKMPGIDDILSSSTNKASADELEDGEITEVDEKNELKELQKRKAEIVSKMKKLVKHKIQLTTERNKLLLQLQSNTQFDKVTTLLKENSQLVKAISNQIFRMNPEIKVLNGKIKELETSIGDKADDDPEQKTEPTPEKFKATKKDLENLENFFNRHAKAGPSKKKEEEVKVKIKEEKVEETPVEGKYRENNATNKFFPLGVNSGPSKPSSLGPDMDMNVKLLLASTKPRRLVSDENKMKMIFEKVCENTEKKQTLFSGTSRSTSSVDKKLTKDSDEKQACSRAPTDAKKPADSMLSSIDKRLKEIRMQGAKNSPEVDGVQEKRKRKISPVRADKGRISPISFGRSNSHPGTLEKHNKKHKSASDKDIVDSNKKSRHNESTVANSISKSLLERLGSIPVQDKSSVGTSSASEDGESEGFRTDNLNSPRGVFEERKSFWCQFCQRGFKSTQTYVVHLESMKHIQIAMSKQSQPHSSQGPRSYKDCDAVKDTTWNAAEDVWYKGSVNKQGDQNTEKAEASSGDICIAVVGNDTFCTKKQLGHFHSRCFAHAKCLIRDKDNIVGYAPDSCSVCMEYLQHCHTSLKCCDRVFRIFKIFKKRCGLSFDWEDNSLKDWFFDNYRKIQDGSDSAKKSTVSYEDFKSQRKQQEVDNNSERLAVENTTSGVIVKKEVELNEEQSLKESMSGCNLSNSSKEESLKCSSFCNLLLKYSGVTRIKAETDLHSYCIAFEKNDPFITEVCQKLLRLDDCIPSLNLLQGIHAHFSCMNSESEQMMTFLRGNPFAVSDLSFQYGEIKGYCNPKLLERFNFTLGFAKSQFNVYAALVAIMSSVKGYSKAKSVDSNVSEFHKCLTESMEDLTKEMLNPLKYYISMALQNKRKLRLSGFKLQGENSTIGTLVRYNIFSKTLFDEAALKKTSENSKHLSKFVNTESSQEKEMSDGVGAVSTK